MHLTDRDLAEYLPLATIILDQAGNMLWSNQSAKNIFKLSMKQNIDKVIPYFNFNDLLNHNPKKPYLLELQQGEKTDKNLHAKKYLALTLKPYLNAQYLLLIEDITHTHHLEKVRQDFVANVSHELRTPLTVLHGYLESLIDQANDIHPAWQNIFLRMQQQTFRMEHLVEDLLLLSRLEIDTPDQEKFQTVNVYDLLTLIIKDAESLSGNKNHSFTILLDKQLKIIGIENELRSAFSNLIFNAVNYTPAGKNITIKWYKKNDCAVLEIIDNGVGIAAEHLERLTERFYRVDRDRSRNSGGTGLGLAIVKHALIRHHAQLKIESSLDQGSKFICIFPKEMFAAE